MDKRIKRPVTLKDISLATGYSVNTVSHALWDKPDIAAATRQLIKNKAKEMGYIGNSIASSLRSGKTRTVAIIVGDISNPHFAVMSKEIEETLQAHGYSAFLMNTGEIEERETRNIQLAIGKSVDGIIICPSQQSEKNLDLLKKSGVPYVLIGRRFPDNPDVSYVVSDDEKSGYLLGKHLLSKGHRRVLFLNGPEYISSARERLAGVRRAFSELGDPETTLYNEFCSALRGNVREPLVRNLELHPEITAILGFSDILSWEIMLELDNMGIQVPEDMAVAGFDNLQSRLMLPVSLTSVSASKVTMARTAAELLCQNISDPTLETKQIVLDVDLIDRGSV